MMAISINAEYLKLQALANVCEAAQKLHTLPLPAATLTAGNRMVPSSTYPNATAAYGRSYGDDYSAVPFTLEWRRLDSTPSFTRASQSHYTLTAYSQPPLPLPTYGYSQHNHFSPHMTVPSTLHAPLPAWNPAPMARVPSPLTPPLTPVSTPHCTTQPYPVTPVTPSPQPQQTQTCLNPVLKSVLAYTRFQSYLDETWPEDSSRRGSAVIRASLYRRIADALGGGETNARFKQWLKKSEFFIVQRMQSGGVHGSCLAVPAVKSRGSAKAGGSKATRYSYKLVARLEDFAYIIGNYHNDQNGHHGIRRTYALIQEDFSYLPRAAVSKFIELCDICSLHRQKSGSSVLRPAQELDTCIDGAKTRRSREKAAKGSPSLLDSSQSTTEAVTTAVPEGHPSKPTDSANCVSELAESPLPSPVAGNKENVLTG